VRTTGGKRPLGTYRHNGRILLKWIIKKWGGAWIGLIWLWIGMGGGHL
jgi:hypothetical protein